MAGDPVAQVAEGGYVLRLRVPERHAHFIRPGDPVRLDAKLPSAAGAPIGKITLVYPEIQDGRVVADAKIDGLGDYFVGERVRVWIETDKRAAFIVPEALIETRFGIDYVRVKAPKGDPVEVPVQRGRPLPQSDMPDGIELLSGVKAGDALVAP